MNKASSSDLEPKAKASRMSSGTDADGMADNLVDNENVDAQNGDCASCSTGRPTDYSVLVALLLYFYVEDKMVGLDHPSLEVLVLFKLN